MASHKAARTLEGWSVQQALKLLRLTKNTRAAILYRSGGEEMLALFELPLSLVYKDIPSSAKLEVLDKVRAYAARRRNK